MQPATLDEAAKAVREAGRVAIGKWSGPPDVFRLDLRRLAGPVEITPENLSATFLAGTTIRAVDDALAPYGLWWPVDARPDRTLGAVLATGGPHPGRTGYGPVRDWVLGLEVILAGGARMHLGGQTMKNVAGYDLTRLFIGSGGTLGVIGAATLRLLPRPAEMATLILPQEHWTKTLDLAAACEWDGSRLLVRVDGRPNQVARRIERLTALGGEVVPPSAWTDWYRRSKGRYVEKEAPDWSTVGAPLLGRWRTDEPPPLSRLALWVREAVAPGSPFNPAPKEVRQHA